MDFAEIIFALYIVVVAVVSLLSNLLVLLCFVHSTEIRRQVPGVFTMNLSFCNILITVLNMPATLVGIVRHQQPFGDCVCHTVSFLDTFLTANTMLSMAALSIDRWIAVVFPLSYATKMRYKDALIMVCYSWLHSFTFSLTALLFSWVDYSDVYASCTLQSTEGGSDRIKFTVFTVVFHATSFMLSLLILCFTYLKVLKVARFHCKRIDIITMQTLFLLVDIHPSVKQRCLVEQKRRKQRATKKISIFIGSFIICFAPYVITSLDKKRASGLNCTLEYTEGAMGSQEPTRWGFLPFPPKHQRFFDCFQEKILDLEVIIKRRTAANPLLLCTAQTLARAEPSTWMMGQYTAPSACSRPVIGEEVTSHNPPSPEGLGGLWLVTSSPMTGRLQAEGAVHCPFMHVLGSARARVYLRITCAEQERKASESEVKHEGGINREATAHRCLFLS
ncbi:unnamed protein product [Menidia menidia]|uniref:(Atlantic silverside) hypothetical protein n=1 Tax=Menidia menidia TaxID=238744 RepID=A0A8S4BCY4_9TELE|nr:unnamed protein product [Menidia menidia]